jgi:hypothetical protein
MNIGFYLLDINSKNQQHAKILESINSLCKLRPYDNIVLFNSKYNNVDLDHKYYILHINQAKYFDGILFVFDIKSALLTRTFPCPKKQVLYLTSNDWSTNTKAPYVFWKDIFMNKDFELIVSNPKLYAEYNICWKTPIAIIDEYNPTDMHNVIQKL